MSSVPHAEVALPVRSRESRRRTSREPTAVSANMTPMIDIVFNLLIFFLVGSSFKIAEGLLPSKLPATHGIEAGSRLPLRPIKITLSRIGETTDAKDCEIVVENAARQPNNFAELYGILLALKDSAAYSEESPVLLIPGADVRFGHVVNAFNAVMRAKFTSIGFASY